jgi:hypothetical protein
MTLIIYAPLFLLIPTFVLWYWFFKYKYNSREIGKKDKFKLFMMIIDQLVIITFSILFMISICDLLDNLYGLVLYDKYHYTGGEFFRRYKSMNNTYGSILYIPGSINNGVINYTVTNKYLQFCQNRHGNCGIEYTKKVYDNGIVPNFNGCVFSCRYNRYMIDPSAINPIHWRNNSSRSEFKYKRTREDNIFNISNDLYLFFFSVKMLQFTVSLLFTSIKLKLFCKDLLDDSKLKIKLFLTNFLIDIFYTIGFLYLNKKVTLDQYSDNDLLYRNPDNGFFTSYLSCIVLFVLSILNILACMSDGSRDSICDWRVYVCVNMFCLLLQIPVIVRYNDNYSWNGIDLPSKIVILEMIIRYCLKLLQLIPCTCKKKVLL